MRVMAVSEQVRKLIKDCPMSRYRLCKAAGVNEGNLTQFMAGNRGLSQESLDALGAVLGFRMTMDRAKARVLAANARKPGRPRMKQPKRKGR
jgi:transcriptional regulator with XRE-family HTH domain